MKEIASALVKAQKAFGPALKTHRNEHFKSRYADLAACIDAVIDGLNDNGIALIQQTHECDSGVLVETTFVHESGEVFSAGRLHVPAAKHDPQGYGSALTYARRYSLMAACGIAAEDDDGNAASKPKPRVEKPSGNPLDAIKPKAGLPLMTPGSESPRSFHADPTEWLAAYEQLAQQVVSAGKAPPRERMTKLRELRQANEATLGLLTPEQLGKAAETYKQRLATLGAAMKDLDVEP